MPERYSYYSKWSRDRDLNPGPHPYHGCALPTELSRHPALLSYLHYATLSPKYQYARRKIHGFTPWIILGLYRFLL